MKIAIFYHCLFTHGSPRELKPAALGIVQSAMAMLQQTGLLEAAELVVVGVNGTEEESGDYARLVIPEKAQIVYHGLESFAENLTICHLQEWAKTHPGWAVLYFHAKGATHPPESAYATGVSGPWRDTMITYLVGGWRQCVADLQSGAEIACCHWMWNMADGTQHIPAGNMLWVTSDFAAGLPSMFERDRIRQDGIAAASSRYEAEVFWGNGRRPHVMQYLPNGGGGVP